MRVIVAGAGESGIVVGRQFSQMGTDVILVDRNPVALKAAEEHLDVMTIAGDVTHRAVLTRIDAGHADAFIAVTGSDSDNLVAAGLAKSAGASVAVARVDDARFFQDSRSVERGILGLDVAVCATRLAAAQILNLITRMRMENVWTFADHGVRCAIAPIGADSVHIGKAPHLLELAESVSIKAVIRGGFMRSAPDAERIEDRDRLVVVGDEGGFLHAWAKLFPDVREQRALIVGGGDVGAILAPALAPLLAQVDLVEVDSERATQLADELDNVRVLGGDARKSDFLRDVQIESVDYLLAVTADNETNLLVSLLARQLGARAVFALLRQAGHADLFKELKVQAAVVFEVLGRSIPEMAIRDGLLRRVTIPNTGVEVIEWRLPAYANAGKTWAAADIPLVPGAILLGHSRDGQIAAINNTKMMGGEAILVACPARERAALTRRLQRFGRELKP